MFIQVPEEIGRHTNAHQRPYPEAGRRCSPAMPRLAIIARDFARRMPAERDATLVLDPTREGRQQLGDVIRAALLCDGQLGDDAITATVLEPCGLGRAEAAHTASYMSGDIVTFRQQARGKPRPGIGYRVESVDAEAGTVRLVPERGKAHNWQPAQ